jgi:hypothetical protein
MVGQVEKDSTMIGQKGPLLVHTPTLWSRLTLLANRASLCRYHIAGNLVPRQVVVQNKFCIRASLPLFPSHEVCACSAACAQRIPGGQCWHWHKICPRTQPCKGGKPIGIHRFHEFATKLPSTHC